MLAGGRQGGRADSAAEDWAEGSRGRGHGTEVLVEGLLQDISDLRRNWPNPTPSHVKPSLVEKMAEDGTGAKAKAQGKVKVHARSRCGIWLDCSQTEPRPTL